MVVSTYYTSCYVYFNNLVRELSAPEATTTFFEHFMDDNDPVYANPADAPATVEHMPDSDYYYHVLRDGDCEHFDVVPYSKLQLNAMFHPAPKYSNQHDNVHSTTNYVDHYKGLHTVHMPKIYGHSLSKLG